MRNSTSVGNRWILAVALWVPLVLTLGINVLARRSQLSRDAKSLWVVHSVDVTGRLSRLGGLAKDLESGWQGYLVTHDQNFLDLCNHAQRLIPYESRSLMLLVADNLEQTAACGRLQALILDESNRAAGSLLLAQRGDFVGAERAARDFAQVSLTVAIRAQTAVVMAAEERLLAERRRAYAEQVDAEDALMTSLVGIDFVLIGGATLVLLHFQRSRQAAQAQTMDANTRTEQSEARGEIAAQFSGLQYQRLFETAPDGILVLDAESGQVVDANPFMKNLLGYSQEEILGRKLWEIGPFKGILASQLTFAELQKSDQTLYENLLLETKAGRKVEVEFTSNAYLVGENRFVQCNIRDLTQRRRSEEHLALLNTCIANLNDVVMVTEADPISEPGPRIVFVNHAFERITGYTSKETLGRNARFLQGEKTDRAVLDEVRKSLARHLPIRRQVVNYGKDGHEYWLDMDIVPVFDAAHLCTHFAAIGRDITEEKRKEKLMLWRTAFFEAQVNSSLDGILIVDNTGKKILQNQRLTELWRIPPAIADDPVDHPQFEWVTTQVKNPREFTEKVVHLMAHPAEVSHDEIPLIDGRFFDRYSAPVVGRDGEEYGRIWSFRDVTDRRRNEARFRRLVDSNAQGVMFWNRNGLITGANDAFLHLVRRSRLDLEAGLLNWVALTSPEYTKHDRRALEEITALGFCVPYEKEYLLWDGTRVPILIGSAAFEDNPDEGVCFVLDLSDRKKLENQVLRNQRMESIGTLAGGIAHDLNNILAPILMAIDLLKQRTTDPQGHRILETLQVSARRGADIVRQVLSFARGVEGEKVEVQPKHLLLELESIIKDTFPKNVRQRFEISGDVWTILGDPTQVHQILMNLCVNARDAMPDGGLLTVAATNSVLDEHYASLNVRARAGRYVKIAVTDTGTGISRDIIDKIFEPFFTTKGLHQGTGLGLSTVMAIVKGHDGIVNVYSEHGKGTIFTIYLPAAEASLSVAAAPLEQAPLPRGNGEKVLIVDDEAAILSITSQTLEEFGYRVLTAVDGAEAVAVYAQHRHDIAVVLTDMSMPIMDGAATIRALTRINPLVKIIAASGLTANDTLARASHAGLRHFIAKPYTTVALLTVLREILDQA